MVFKNPAEIKRVVESNHIANFSDIIRGGSEQFLCLIDSHICKVLLRADPGLAAKQAGKPTYAHIALAGIAGKAEGLMKLGVEHMYSTLDLFILPRALVNVLGK